jgi:hypothetical protein
MGWEPIPSEFAGFLDLSYVLQPSRYCSVAVQRQLPAGQRRPPNLCDVQSEYINSPTRKKKKELRYAKLSINIHFYTTLTLDYSLTAGAIPWGTYRDPPSSSVWVPVMCAAAGDARNSASPAISEGAPKRPVGWLLVKASSPAVFRPKAVILEGNRLGRRQLICFHALY